MIDISIVFVTWNSANVLGEAMESVPEGIPVIVVDNASADGSVKIATGSWCQGH